MSGRRRRACRLAPAAIGRIRAGTGMGDRISESLLASPPELIVRALGRARSRAGSIASYLNRPRCRAGRD